MEPDGPLNSVLQLRLFGSFQVHLYGKPIDGLHKRKGERVLAYLALRAGQWVDTRKMASDLWNGTGTDDPAGNLRQSLSYVRQLLGDESTRLQSRVGAVCLTLLVEQADSLQFEAACSRGDSESIELARRLAEEQLLAEWEDPWINAHRSRFERKLLAAVNRPQARLRLTSTAFHASAAASGQLEESDAAGGAVLLPSRRYIARDADTVLCTAISRGDSIITIKGAWQTGKSSLLARGLQYSNDIGRTTYAIDFEQFSSHDMESPETLYLRIIALLADQAGDDFNASTEWKDHLGASGNLERFLRRHIVAGNGPPLVWALDGVDKLFRTDYFEEFFALLRGVHTKRATEPGVAWSRLTVIIVTATEAHLYIRDLNQSPFNVGTRILVEDFDSTQCAKLRETYGFPPGEPEECEQVNRLLGGHPYLLARGLQEMRNRKMNVGEFTEYAQRSDGPYHDHLSQILRLLSADSGLCDDMRAVFAGAPCSEEGFFRLRSSGLLTGSTPDTAALRCGLYEQYLARHLIN